MSEKKGFLEYLGEAINGRIIITKTDPPPPTNITHQHVHIHFNELTKENQQKAQKYIEQLKEEQDEQQETWY